MERWVQKQTQIRLSVAGINFRNPDGAHRQKLIRRLRSAADQSVRLLREPSNPVDHDAIAVVSAVGQIGYLRREDAELIGRKIDHGVARYTARVSEIERFTTEHGVKLLAVQLDVIEWEFREAVATSKDPPLPNIGPIPRAPRVWGPRLVWCGRRILRGVSRVAVWGWVVAVKSGRMVQQRFSDRAAK